MAQRQNDRGPVNPFEPPPDNVAPSNFRFKHPLSVDAPTVRRAFTLNDVAPLLEAYMQELIARVVLSPAHGEPGWLWALNRRFIARVSGRLICGPCSRCTTTTASCFFPPGPNGPFQCRSSRRLP